MSKHKTDTTFTDVPELAEVFSDSTHRIVFDGATLRIEFCCKRMKEPKPPAPPQFQQVPVARVVLSAGAGVELVNSLNRMFKMMQDAAKAQQAPPTVN